MYEVCERLRISYTFGLSTNAVLQRDTEGLLAEAVAGYERERQAARQQEPPRPPVPSRLFTGFWYQAGTWSQPRWVVAKAEANDRGTNRRFVVTNRPGAVLFPEPTYDQYAGRGESENRNKELKCGLGMDRLSDHRFLANYFRLYLHAVAMNLLARIIHAAQRSNCQNECKPLLIEALRGARSGAEARHPAQPLMLTRRGGRPGFGRCFGQAIRAA
jgi:hypothetical protein